LQSFFGEKNHGRGEEGEILGVKRKRHLSGEWEGNNPTLRRDQCQGEVHASHQKGIAEKKKDACGLEQKFLVARKGRRTVPHTRTYNKAVFPSERKKLREGGGSILKNSKKEKPSQEREKMPCTAATLVKRLCRAPENTSSGGSADLQTRDIGGCRL